MSCPICGHAYRGVGRGRGAWGTGPPVPHAGSPWADATVPRAGRSLLDRPAPVSARLGAAVIDELVLTVPLIAVLLLGLRATRTPGGAWGLVSTVALLCWVVAVLLYAVIGGGEGQTPGKRALGIVVVDHRTGTPIGYERALVRSVVLLLMGLPCCLGLLSVVSNRSDRRRGWHDRAAGSVVVRGSLA